MTDFKALLRILSDAGVEFIVIGGAAAAAHGTARATFDLDIVYRRTADNISRLVLALGPYHPRLRDVPPGFPFRWEAATIRLGLNFIMTTDVGDVNAPGEVTGGGSYEALLPSAVVIRPFGVEYRLLGLDRLIEVKRAAGCPRDFEVIAELETVRDLRRELGAA